MTSEIYANRADLFYEWNDLKTAEEDLLAAFEIGQLYPNTALILLCLMSLSRLHLAQGDLKDAEKLLHEIEQRAMQMGPSMGISILSTR